MNINVSKISNNFYQQTAFLNKSKITPGFKANDSKPELTYSVYGDNPIRTNPAQLSLFALHDFHGQDITMERVYTLIEKYDKDELVKNNNFFDKNNSVDKLKLASGDMFLGENRKELEVVNEFLNLAGIVANAIGNHECDNEISEFSEIVKNRNYKFLAANMHPEKDNAINKILSNSLIVETNGNQYGIIGLSPIDMAAHMKRPKEVEEFGISGFDDTIEDLQNNINELKKRGVNKIILLSHLGYEHEKYIAKNVSDIDVILGGHTHNLITEAKKGENVLCSPKGEPVLIMQVGRDGNYVGLPNLQFNELGQITKLQYNIAKTSGYKRSPIAQEAFEKILGKPEVVGSVAEVEEPPKNIYANENPHCDFILDCMREEYDTDIAIMNSANIRGRFHKGAVNTRDLAQISPFGNKITIIRLTEEELVDAIDDRIENSMESPVNRPGILQVSGLRYEFSRKEGELTKLTFIDKQGNEIPIDIENPREDKFYTLVSDDYCITRDTSGMDLQHRFDEAIAKFDFDKNKVVENYLKKHPEPVVIKSDGRIKSID